MFLMKQELVDVLNTLLIIIRQDIESAEFTLRSNVHIVYKKHPTDGLAIKLFDVTRSAQLVQQEAFKNIDEFMINYNMNDLQAATT